MDAVQHPADKFGVVSSHGHRDIQLLPVAVEDGVESSQLRRVSGIPVPEEPGPDVRLVQPVTHHTVRLCVRDQAAGVQMRLAFPATRGEVAGMVAEYLPGVHPGDAETPGQTLSPGALAASRGPIISIRIVETTALAAAGNVVLYRGCR